MLVLQRKRNESVIVTDSAGKRIKLTVIDVRRGRVVRLGFEAPDSIRIDREEIDFRRQNGASPQ